MEWRSDCQGEHTVSSLRGRDSEVCRHQKILSWKAAGHVCFKSQHRAVHCHRTHLLSLGSVFQCSMTPCRTLLWAKHNQQSRVLETPLLVGRDGQDRLKGWLKEYRQFEPRARPEVRREMLHAARVNALQGQLSDACRYARWNSILERRDAVSVSYHSRCARSRTSHLPDGNLPRSFSVS